MLKIGLTGGIGSGKTTVANLFKQQHSIPIIDADVIAHQLVTPQKPALLQLEKTFGSGILNAKGELDRNQLRTIVFADKTKKQQLENILHPLIYQQMQREFEQQTSPYSLLCIPLLIETQMMSFVDYILVIDRDVETQIQRVKQRNKLSETAISSIIHAQVSRKKRLSYADNVINNSDSTFSLAEVVRKLHNHYLFLSKS